MGGGGGCGGMRCVGAALASFELEGGWSLRSCLCFCFLSFFNFSGLAVAGTASSSGRMTGLCFFSKEVTSWDSFSGDFGLLFSPSFFCEPFFAFSPNLSFQSFSSSKPPIFLEVSASLRARFRLFESDVWEPVFGVCESPEREGCSCARDLVETFQPGTANIPVSVVLVRYSQYP